MKFKLHFQIAHLFVDRLVSVLSAKMSWRILASRPKVIGWREAEQSQQLPTDFVCNSGHQVAAPAARWC